MKILVVEANQDMGPLLKALFKGYPYAVDRVEDSETGVDMLASFNYDLLLLNLSSEQDEISFCRRLRAQHTQLPILLLTACSSGSHRAAVLNAGADDCVVKPFDSEELTARMQVLLRRRSTVSSPRLVWGRLWINLSACLAVYGGHLLALTPKEYAILEVLLRHHQRPLSAAALLDYGWDAVTAPGEETIRGYIKTLRKKLAEAGAPPDLIKTVHRVGYRLNRQYSRQVTDEWEQSSAAIKLINAVNFNDEELRVALEELLVNQTDLQQRNQALAGSQARLESLQHQYRSLIDHLAEGVIISDRQGHIQSVNPVAATLLGRDVASLIGQSLRLFIPPGDRPRFQHHVEAALLRQHPWTVSLSAPRGDLWLELLPASAADKAGRPLALQWLLRPQQFG
ncbi:MAG: response regulator [Leptolyngbya sp. RL_3_1]|nr:response regulator [Leptolyngbya sp. RL_3_1]